MDARAAPCVQVGSILIEHLDSVVISVRHVYASVPVRGHGVDSVGLTVPVTPRSPGQNEVTLPVELDDPGVVEAVCHERAPVGEEGHVLWAPEVRFVLTLHERLSQLHEEFLSVIRKDVDLIADLTP